MVRYVTWSSGLGEEPTLNFLTSPSSSSGVSGWSGGGACGSQRGKEKLGVIDFFEVLLNCLHTKRRSCLLASPFLLQNLLGKLRRGIPECLNLWCN
jgi:hypothetical protein